MSQSAFGTPSYGLTRRYVGADFDAAVAAARAALATQGFGVLTEIDVSATLKKKIDADIPRYLILGACNPPLAFEAITAERAIGLLLPCNVVVADDGDAIVISAIDPGAMFSVLDRPEIAPLADAVKGRLNLALDAISL